MPWCEPCARYFAPPALTREGCCPDCGERLGDPDQLVTADNLDLKKLAGIDDDSLPWHFKLLVTLLVLYMGWRVVDIFV